MAIYSINDMVSAIEKGQKMFSLGEFNLYCENSNWAEVPRTGYSRISGTATEKANFDWFFANKFNHSDVIFMRGDYGTRVVYYNTATEDQDLQETIDALHEYPSIDDTLVGQVQSEWIEQAWNSWAYTQFLKALAIKLDVWSVDFTEEQAQEYFDMVRDKLNMSWYEHEGSMDIDVERIVDSIDPEDFFAEYVGAVTY